MCVRACLNVCLEEGCFVWDEGLSELGSERKIEREENALRGDEGSKCCEQSPVIGRIVIQCKSILNPVYSLFEADMYAFLITLFSYVIRWDLLGRKFEDKESVT